MPAFWAATIRYRIETLTQSEKKLLVLKDSYANCYLALSWRPSTEDRSGGPKVLLWDLEELMQVEENTGSLILYNANTFFYRHFIYRLVLKGGLRIFSSLFFRPLYREAFSCRKH